MFILSSTGIRITASTPQPEMAGRQESQGNITYSGQQSYPPTKLFCNLSIRNSWSGSFFEELTQDRPFYQQFTRAHRLVVTREDPCPIKVKNENWCIRTDLEIYQEEADVIIVQQVLNSIGEARQVTVISDDTNVIVITMWLASTCH
jgi:hypothetical protein